MGNIATYSTAVEAVVFLVVWLFYGMVMGYLKAKSFIKFISLYWGINGLVYVLSIFLAPIGKLAILVIPIVILTLAPTYGLGYFVHLGTHGYLFEIKCITLSWSSGAIGYSLGYLLKKSRVQRIQIVFKRAVSTGFPLRTGLVTSTRQQAK